MIPENSGEKLKQIEGEHYHWRDLFDKPKGIYEYLLDKKFDKERHEQLKGLVVTPDYQAVKVNKEVTKALINEMLACL